MNKRRLSFGFGLLLIVIGSLLAAFTPGGLFNHGAEAAIDTPFARISVRDKQRPSTGPIIGYILLGVGGMALVVAFALKPPESAGILNSKSIKSQNHPCKGISSILQLRFANIGSGKQAFFLGKNEYRHNRAPTFGVQMGPTSLSMLGRLRSGGQNSGEWSRLQDIYLPLLRFWLQRVPGIGDEVDDLAQEVMLVVLRELPSFERRRDGSFRTWLRKITLNRIRAFQKNRRKRPCAGGVDQFDDLLGQLADPDSDLSQEWDAEHDKYVFQKLLAVVRPDFETKTWEAFQRFGVEDRPAAAVAADLGISQTAVVQAKFRVLKRLREEAGELME